MPKALTQTIQDQITYKDIQATHIFKINGTDYTDYLRSWNVSHSKDFGSASGNFVLLNDAGLFGQGGANQINVGDIVELIETYEGDVTQFKSFYGRVEQRSISKTAQSRLISLTCLDYISTLKNWDINKKIEGTKVEVTDEVLSPNYLDAPNDMYAQIFDFANNTLAQDPAVILLIRNTDHGTDDPQYDGFDVYHDVGQVKFGSPINTLYNYQVRAKSYWFYTQGLHCEDVIETLLTEPDGYGNYMFGEATAQAVIDNHLTTNFEAEDGTGVSDTLTPNYTTTNITIKTQLAQNYTAGASVLYLTSVDGFPASGEGNINGDTFSWTNVVAHENKLEGIPAVGGYSMKSHTTDSYAKYTADYEPGKVWYLSYSNITTALVEGNFTIPAGANFSFFEARQGRIVLDGALSTSATLTCDINYNFKTLQATGIEINGIDLRSREVKNRFEALKKVRDNLAPNYIIRTQGDDLVWASYLSQNTTPDYTLDLVKSLNYMEDSDLFTRVLLYGKNKNPSNLMYGEDVTFLTTGESYKAFASQVTLTFDKTVDGWHEYKTVISDAGYIKVDEFTPEIFIDGVPVDNQLHQMIMQPMYSKLKTRTETTTTQGGKGDQPESTSKSFYYYTLYFGHQSIEPTESIRLYNATGSNVFTISPNDPNMDYGRGILDVPGTAQNSTIESLATATYWVRYSSNAVDIDYDNVRFKVNEIIIPNTDTADVWATFEYFTVFTPANGTAAIMDGRWDTQLQTEFFAEPPTGYNYAILDLGQTRSIQAVDVVAGHFKPDDYRKFDVDFRMTIQTSLDNIDYYEVSDETHSFGLTTGESKSFEEKELGVGLTARYIKVLLENVTKLEFGPNDDSEVFPVAITEVSVYSDIVIQAESKLIGTTQLTAPVADSDTTINVITTANFDSTGTAYIGTGAFSYTGTTATTFTGVDLDSGVTGSTNGYVYQKLEDDNDVYDKDDLRTTLGDRLYKSVRVKDDVLYTQTELNRLAKAFLLEFYKDHSKITCNVVYSPYLKVGQTVQLTDSYNNVSSENYFIDSLQNNTGNYQLVLAKYPA